MTKVRMERTLPEKERGVDPGPAPLPAKSESRIPKLETNSNHQLQNRARPPARLPFGASILEISKFVSNFAFRISSFSLSAPQLWSFAIYLKSSPYAVQRHFSASRPEDHSRPDAERSR